MILVEERFKIKCDSCGFETSWRADRRGLVAAARNCGWAVLRRPGKDYCPKCSNDRQARRMAARP